MNPKIVKQKMCQYQTFKITLHVFCDGNLNFLISDDFLQNAFIDESDNDSVLQQKNTRVCVICDKKFSNKYKIALHLLSTYHKNRTKGHPDAIKVLEQYHKYIVWLSPYQCTICQFYFNRNQDFMDHLKSESHQMQCEGLDGEIMCSICKYCCHDNGSLVQHFENDSAHALASKKGCKPCIIKENNYDAECKYCKKTLHSKLHMKRHMRAQHFKEYELSCKLFNKTFDFYSYKCHMSACQHSLQAKKERKFEHKSEVFNEGINCTHINPQEDKPYTEHKSEVFNEGINRTHINRQEDKPYKLAKKIVRNIHKSHKCDYCDFVSLQYDELRNHYFEQHANHLFVCELCDVTFITEKARKIHFAGLKHQTNMNQSDGNTTSVIEQCDYCDRRFEDEKLKLFHTEVYHLHPNSEESLREKLGHEDTITVKYQEFLASIDSLKDERVQCPECPKKILMKDYILEHLRCRWSFFLIYDLTAHYRSHTGERAYLCDICGYSAGTRNRLNQHHRSHAGVRDHHCEYCNYKAGTRSHLRRHMRIHIGSKPFKCPYCSYRCNTRENIRKHIAKTKKHAGLPMYPCQFCEYGTNDTVDFRFHLEQKHKGEFNLEGSGGLAIIAGLYMKHDDPDKPMEGTEIFQVRERKTRKNQE